SDQEQSDESIQPQLTPSPLLLPPAASTDPLSPLLIQLNLDDDSDSNKIRDPRPADQRMELDVGITEMKDPNDVDLDDDGVDTISEIFDYTQLDQAHQLDYKEVYHIDEPLRLLTNEKGILGYAYGRPVFRTNEPIHLFQLPICSRIYNSTQKLDLDEKWFGDDIATYLDEHMHKPYGIPVPQELLQGATLIGNITFFAPPDLPPLPYEFPKDDFPHPDKPDNFKYIGCLPRYNATIFRRYWRSFDQPICTNIACLRMALQEAENHAINIPFLDVDWENEIYPAAFRILFCFPTPTLYYRYLTQCFPSRVNCIWLKRIPYLFNINRLLASLLHQLENLFRALGFSGLKELLDRTPLWTDLDYQHNPYLSTEEATYLTCAYNFFQRERKRTSSTELLQLLRMDVEDCGGLEWVWAYVVDITYPPHLYYNVRDEKDAEGSMEGEKDEMDWNI
ncbi:hypothetical protein CPB83DRAFT_837480, partial [Crepidotus variabilis]